MTEEVGSNVEFLIACQYFFELYDAAENDYDRAVALGLFYSDMQRLGLAGLQPVRLGGND